MQGAATMLFSRFAIALVLTAQAASPALDWRSSQSTAAAALHVAWFQSLASTPDVDLSEALGRLYAAGRGVEHDPALACAAAADVVIHAAVAGQHAQDMHTAPGEAHPRLAIATINDVRVVSVFKSAGASSGALVVRQFGGVIDRGGSVDTLTFNRLPPLNVGDEYVLFARRGQDGQLWLSLSDHGVFLIRNGRVRPFANTPLAAAWKDRSADRFLEALRTRVR